jgi:hypothetical protein
MAGIYLVKTSWVCSVPFLKLKHIPYHRFILRIFMVYHRYIIIKKGTEQTHEVFTRYIPAIWMTCPYAFDMPCIYHVYTMYIQFKIWYTSYIPGIFFVYTTWYILSIYCAYTIHMYSIFCVYTMYIPCIYMVYIWYIHGIYMVYYILHPVAGVVEEGGRAGARLPTCGAAPTYCHAGTATRAHTRARLHVSAHPSARRRAPCGIPASAPEFRPHRSCKRNQ